MKRLQIIIILVSLFALRVSAQSVESESNVYSFNINGKVVDKVSDVDVDIPALKKHNGNTYVVAIANEDYWQIDQKSSFAIHDGEVFKEYCEKTLGVPSTNIRLMENATLKQVNQSMEWLANVAGNQNINVVFYYSGHGVSNEQCNACLLPIDCNPSMPESFLNLNDLLGKLGDLNAKTITCFIDACFNGVTREGDSFINGGCNNLDIRMPSHDCVAFFATQGNETAYCGADIFHGLFTYCLLQQLKDKRGETTYGDIAASVKKEVGDMSSIMYEKQQVPFVMTSGSLSDEWMKIRF